MAKKQKNIWIEEETFEWVRKKAFDLRESESVYIENLIKKEMKKDGRNNK